MRKINMIDCWHSILGSMVGRLYKLNESPLDPCVLWLGTWFIVHQHAMFDVFLYYLIFVTFVALMAHDVSTDWAGLSMMRQDDL